MQDTILTYAELLADDMGKQLNVTKHVETETRTEKMTNETR